MEITVAVGNKRFDFRKEVIIEFVWSNQSFFVVMLVVHGLFSKIVLGLDWLRTKVIIIDCARNFVYKGSEENEIAENCFEKERIEGDINLESKLLSLKAKKEQEERKYINWREDKDRMGDGEKY